VLQHKMDTYGLTQLHRAVCGTQYEFVWFLLQPTVSAHLVSAKDSFGNTPLHNAVLASNTKMVEILLEHGADVSVRNTKGRTPLWCVVKTPELVRNDIEYSDYLQRFHIDVVQLLLRKGADIKAKDDSMKTPLMAAAQDGMSYLVQLLLKQGADVTPADLACAASGEDRARTFQIFDAVGLKRFRKVASLLRTALKKRRALHLCAEKSRRSKCMAFAMGQHARVGADSLIQTIPPELVKMILERV
jgi:ankyrin repeat protein